MKNFKDFMYKSNDIVLAIVILVAALLIIGWRTQVIMDYPKTLTEASKQQQETTKNQEQAKTDNMKKETKSDTSAQASSDVYKDGKLTKKVSVQIKAGASSEEAIKPLINAKLFSNYDDFAKTCKSAGVNPENVRADNFTFEAGATKADIAKKVTQ